MYLCIITAQNTKGRAKFPSRTLLSLVFITVGVFSLSFFNLELQCTRPQWQKTSEVTKTDSVTLNNVKLILQ